MIEDAVILVGGKGSRLKKLTKKTPKPLLLINNRSFLDILISFIARSKIKRIYLLSSYKSKQFEKKYHNQFILSKKIIVIKEEKRSGTGGALFYLKKYVKKNFLLFNGDSIVNINLNKFIEFSLKNKNSLINMLLVKNKYYKSNSQASSLQLNNRYIVRLEKNKLWMNGGMYFINKSLLKKVVKKNFSFEKKILETSINKKKVFGLKTNKPFIDIGTPSSFKKSTLFIQKYFKEKVIFLDRDGVINKDYGYVYKLSKFKILDGVVEAIKYANSKGYHIICITNQSGIGRGYFKEKNMHILHEYLNKLMQKNSCRIERFYFCPHHPNYGVGKYKKDCFYRKPKPGMILKAISDFNVIKNKSFLIGDKKSDQIASNLSNIDFYFRKNTSLLSQIKKYIKLNHHE